MEEINFASVTKQYRKEQSLSQEKFGEALSVEIEKWDLTSQAISLWENGSSPSFYDLFLVWMTYSDWRKEWAIDCIVAKMPKAFSRDENGALTVVSER